MAAPLPPRVLLVLPDQWHRALLRAQLREGGYDAFGAPDLAAAQLYPAVDSDRGPVGLILVDHGALGVAHAESLLTQLLERHVAPALLLAPAGVTPGPGPWAHILHRPISIADLVREIRRFLPPQADQLLG